MSGPPPDVAKARKLVSYKAQAGTPLYKCLDDIENAARAYFKWWLKGCLPEQLAEADGGENRQSNSVEKESRS